MEPHAALALPSGRAGWRLPAVGAAAWPLATIAALLLAQFWLIFVKSFNWDEFLHFSMVYQLRDGTLARPFQTLLARLLAWAPAVSDDLIVQMTAARIFAWSAFVLGLGALYGLARQFASREDAAWATLAYLAAGNVFAHGFAIRTDPLAMATLISALYLLARRRLGWGLALAVGALVGFAGILTMKAVFYAPCFAGIAWLRLSEADDRRAALLRLAAIVPVAGATFAAIYLYHRAGLAPLPASQAGGSILANGVQWFAEGLLRQPRHTLIALLTAPVLVYALVKAPAAWRESGAGRARTVALVGLCLPLLVILFYRNVFPYLFVYLFAPVAVALAPAMATLRKRHGRLLLAAAIVAIPVTKFVAEPRDVLERQRALIGYVHAQYPAGAVSFDYSGMVADHPRVVDHLISGIGLANYNKRGVPLVANAVENGQLQFVIANHILIAKALKGKTVPGGLPAADVAALQGNYVRVWGQLWLAGEEVAAGPDRVAIDVPAGGTYTPDWPVTVDGVARLAGEAFPLGAGRHVVAGPRPVPAVLWRGERLPAPAPTLSAGPLFTEF